MAIQVYFLFKVSSGNEMEACKQIAEFDNVLVASVVYGEYDIIAKVAVKNLQALEEFLAKNMRKVPSVLLTSTMVIAQEYKGKSQRTKK